MNTLAVGVLSGSYVTFRSKDGLIFGVINIIGNFATVFLDQSYWQRAIASRPGTTVKAYLLGGLAWFAIPFTFATTLGLSAVALRGDPDMISLSADDVSAGLPAAAAASALLGSSGAAALLVLLFCAVTSAISTELIAVSSLLTYNVYKRYVNPGAMDNQLLRMGHYMVGLYGLVMAFAGLIFYFIGVSMGWLYDTQAFNTNIWRSQQHCLPRHVQNPQLLVFPQPNQLRSTKIGIHKGIEARKKSPL
ncbi:hypothetical protein D9757_010246 [Collybiopsis confluens]|uniref:Urea transporter n=1 Tax=Collybiopsis confluens TaxID=2823264 RepID=A0A8H5HB30_9AGAR|nr:hypothetical protein D9757_010246 [Collybiopsis confluens]